MNLNRVFGKGKRAVQLVAYASGKGVLKHHVLSSEANIHSDQDHLFATVQWLKTAQDRSVNDGVSATYSPLKGWTEAYPETTGYIIETMLRFAKRHDDADSRERAVRMGDWEISIQLPEGAVRGGVGTNTYPIIFNTGQVMLGWNALYRDTGEKRFLDAAVRAAEWLKGVQDEDGCWRRDTYNGIPHAYNSRVAWAVLETARLAGRDDLTPVGRRNIEWVLSCERENGWIDHMEFVTGVPPFTHTIAYTLRGLLETIPYLPDLEEAVTGLVKRASLQIAKHNLRLRDGHDSLTFLPGTLGSDWRSRERYSCLTGDAQMAIVYLKLGDRLGDDRFRQAAFGLIDEVKAAQCIEDCSVDLRGAVAGSHPVWGGYLKYTFPNWAAKFFADALMEKMDRVEGAD